MKELLMLQLLPQLLNFLIVGLLAMISAIAHRWFGISVEGKHREALQSALANGARLLLQPGGTIEEAIDYVLRSVPDALKRFGKTSPDDIRTLLEPHILSLPKQPTLKVTMPMTGAGSDAEITDYAADVAARAALPNGTART
jgi:hypothetical protein